MAYMDFRGFDGLAPVQTQASGPVADPVCVTERLSALEWLVVSLARRDSLASLSRPGRLSTAMRMLFNQPNPRLADERLEALRRMAVLTWHHGYTVAPREVRAFVAAGFTLGQYELMVDSIGVAKASRPTRGALAA